MRDLRINFDIKNTGRPEDEQEVVKGCRVVVKMDGATEDDIARLLEKSQSLTVAIQNGGIRALKAEDIRKQFVDQPKVFSWKGPFTTGSAEKEAKRAEAAISSMSDEALMELLRKRGLAK